MRLIVFGFWFVKGSFADGPFFVVLCFLSLFTLFGCEHPIPADSNSFLVSAPTVLVDTTGVSIQTRFKVPTGFQRTSLDSTSFGFYLRGLPLEKDGAPILLFNGKRKAFQDGAVAIIKMDVGTQNLQQCADAVIRLRAEYLFQAKKYDQIHFNFTNGFKAEYSKWAEGNRIIFTGGKTSWSKTASVDYSYKTLRSYLQTVFAYAGTASLTRELRPVSCKEIEVGDVFIHGGSPGHAVIVVDVAVNASNERLFLLAQSYMPAQSIHVLNNFRDIDLSPWYASTNDTFILTPEWRFEKSELKRFE